MLSTSNFIFSIPLSKHQSEILFNNLVPYPLLHQFGKNFGDFKVRVIEYIQQNKVSFYSLIAHFGIPSDATVGK